MPTRGWELLAGSILAYFEISNGQRSQNKTLNYIYNKNYLIKKRELLQNEKTKLENKLITINKK